MLKEFWKSGLLPTIFVVANFSPFDANMSHAEGIKNSPTGLNTDERELSITGRCFNGAEFHLFSYQKPVDGHYRSFYDYEGPAGKGTVRTEIHPKVMAARLCRNLAEIIDDPNLD